MRRETIETVRKLCAETGHVLVVEDCDDIAALDRAASELADDVSDLDLKPVYVGGVKVLPMTLYRAMWIEWAREWAGGDAALEAGAYGIALSEPCETLDAVHDTDTLRHAAIRWFRRTPWTHTQFQEALEYRLIFGGGSGQPCRTSSLVAFLACEYGGTPDYWLRDVDVDIIEGLVREWTEKQEAMARAARSRGHGGGQAPLPSPKFAAARRFREQAEKMRSKWQRPSP